MPVILSLILMFGIFRLSAREMLVNVAISLVCFGVAIGSLFWLDRPGHNRMLDLAYGVMVILVLAGSTFLGVRIQGVRLRLQEQKLALADALEKINHLASHDELTGLVNRRHMTTLVQLERERCVRSGRPLVLALLDIDLFKLVNDQHGHATGDAVLCAFALCIQDTLRSTDVLARWGGEEFLLLLAETEVDGALILLERIRRQVESLRVTGAAGEIKVTVSAGVAASKKGETLEQVLEVRRRSFVRSQGSRTQPSGAIPL